MRRDDAKGVGPGPGPGPGVIQDETLWDSSSDNMATDWSQWMRWDDFDGLSASTNSLRTEQATPNFGATNNAMEPGDLNFNDSRSFNFIDSNQNPDCTTTNATAAATNGTSNNSIATGSNGLDANSGLLPPFIPTQNNMPSSVRGFGSFSHDMVTPFAPAYSPQYASLKRHSIAVPASAFQQSQMCDQMPLVQQDLAFRFSNNTLNVPGQNGQSAATSLSRPLLNPQRGLPSAFVSRKRKSADDTSVLATAGDVEANDPSVKSSTSPQRVLPSKKRSHNVIEKRYRANLNEKIAELRDSVPSLRVIARQRSRAGLAGSPHCDGNDAENDEDSIGAGGKLNKASILSKATEYIRHLEARNKRLDEENVDVKNRLRQFEKAAEQTLVAASAPHNGMAGVNRNSASNIGVGMHSPDSFTISTVSGSHGSPIFSHAEHPDECSHRGTPNPLYPPEGLIKVPEYLRSMRPTGPQPHYADDYRSSQPSSNSNSNNSSPTVAGATTGGGPGGSSRFMLGTLAALMIVGVEESIHGRTEDGKDRGLLGVPIGLTREGANVMGAWVRASLNAGAGLTRGHMQALFGVLVSCAAVVGCAFGIFLYLFESGSQRRRRSTKGKVPGEVVDGEDGNRTAGQAQVAVRRQAWLTSIQTVWVPSHSFFPEWFAVTHRTMEYVARCLLGWSLYSSLTGITTEDENARIKAWDIAIDAQLTGGDAEVTRSRLVLTLLAAGTLPRTPARMMLKALHTRIILWRVGPEGSRISGIASSVAKKISSWQWEEARKLHAKLPPKHDDRLPRNLANLLQLPCVDVITDSIVQRAVNVVWNRPTQEATPGDDAMLDMVANDVSVRAPLDYLASWWSCGKLQETLLGTWENVKKNQSPVHDEVAEDERMSTEFAMRLDEVLLMAPAATMASLMARIMKAVFVDEDRVANINAVLFALSKPSRPAANGEQAPMKVAASLLSLYEATSPVPSCIRVDLRLAIRAAMIIAILRRQVIQHAGQLIGIRGRIQFGGNTCSGRDPRLTVAGALKAFNNLPVDAVELGLVGCAALWWALRVVAKEEEEVLKDATSASDAGSNGSSNDSESSKETVKNVLPQDEPTHASERKQVSTATQGFTDSTTPDTPQPPSMRQISSAESVASVISLTSESESSSACATPDAEIEAALHAEADNTIPAPDLHRIASHLAYWARHAYNPVSYGFTPDLNERVVQECFSLCECGKVGEKNIPQHVQVIMPWKTPIAPALHCQ
ncbi:hypothetical protein KEM55_006302 [Ascosphaera atra]|nr:hypothetical protein KEM55_006302 [Ascosphaera atra]